MYGKYTLFYESPKNWGYLRACANSVYRASPRGRGWERGYVDHRVMNLYNNNLADNQHKQLAVHSSELPNSHNFCSRCHLLFHDQVCKCKIMLPKVWKLRALLCRKSSLSPSTVCKCKAFCNPIYFTVCLRPRNLPMKAAPHTELPEIHPFSITQYWLLIGASLSEPHTSVIALRVACVCMFACGHIPEI